MVNIGQVLIIQNKKDYERSHSPEEYQTGYG